MSIIVSALTKMFGGHTAVNDVSFSLERGEFFVVLGPSGCGKTTLLRMIAGLETPDGGSIRLNDRTVYDAKTNLPPESRDVGVVFQSYALWPHMTVSENVAFVARDTADIKPALSAVSLDGFANRRPADLSGGQRQRVALARCLAQRATTVLMDEPLANLDPHLRGAMEEELSAFHARANATTFFITHDQREAMALATRMAVMFDGRIAQIGTPEEIYEQPVNERVARFVGRSSVVNRKLVRPENVVIGGDLTTTVVRSVYRGGCHETVLRLESGETLLIDLSERHEPGSKLGVSIKRDWPLG